MKMNLLKKRINLVRLQQIKEKIFFDRFRQESIKTTIWLFDLFDSGKIFSHTAINRSKLILSADFFYDILSSSDKHVLTTLYIQ